MAKRQVLNNVIVFTILFFYSCKKETGEPAKLYYQYFPVNVGHWVEYDITEINVDEISAYYDTVNYQLREIVESEFIDNQGRPSIRIERYWRTSDTLPWTIKDVWYATRSVTQAEKIEEDYRYLKLVFPVTSSKKWNGNTYNTKPEEEYEYENIHDPMMVNSLSFDSTVTVLQRANSNFIEVSEASEVYATQIGLIKKEDTYFYITYISGNPKYAGYSFTQTVTGYGN